MKASSFDSYAIHWITFIDAFAVVVFALIAAAPFETSPAAAAPLQNPRPVFDERFDDWPLETKISGRVLVNRNLTQFETLDRMLRRAIKDQPVAISAAPEDALGKHLQQFAKTIDDQFDVKVKVLGVEQIRKSLAESNLLYLAAIDGKAENLIKLRDDFQGFIRDGGTLIFDSRFAPFVGAARSNKVDSQGLNLLPNCVIDSDFDGSESAKNRLAAKLSPAQRNVGIGIKDETMILLSGRSLFAFGSGAAVAIPGTDQQPPEFTELGLAGPRGRNSRIDLTQWRRMAIDRSLEPFPPIQPRTPFVENGTLYIVGGGGMPRGLMAEMIEKAGGVENAKLVYVPCSESDAVNQRQRTVEMWKRMGVKHATFIHTKDRNRANTDEEFLEPLKDATMIWFGGGRQWNFADSYYGTRAHRLMKEVLHRGGVIGGSSAGASIQGRFLARATPIGNTSILAPGYERGGLGFLSGVAIDQHFSQRGRQKDMTQLVKKYPQLLGIGIDEATAIVVEKTQAKVIGRGKVYFYDSSMSNESKDEDYIALPAGEVFDLAKRKVVDAAE